MYFNDFELKIHFTLIATYFMLNVAPFNQITKDLNQITKSVVISETGHCFEKSHFTKRGRINKSILQV